MREFLDSGASGEPGAVVRFASEHAGQKLILDSSEIIIPSRANGLFIDASNLVGGITIDADGSSSQPRRAFLVESSATVAMQNLTIRGSYYPNFGGGVAITGGVVTLNYCTLSENHCTGDGGAIGAAPAVDNLLVKSRLFLNYSTLSNNSSAKGGAIYIRANTGPESHLTVSGCTISGNEAELGGGIFCKSDGQNLNKARGYLRLNFHASTISDNIATIAGGGVYKYSYGTASFLARLEPFIFVSSSIIAGNHAPEHKDFAALMDAAGFVTGFKLDGSNIFSSTSGSPNLLSYSSPKLIVSDPQLAPLGNYGGSLQTMIPLPGSVAVNKSPHAGGSFDQRGGRFSGMPDVGAVESLGTVDVPFVLQTDNDGDGSDYGVELALGTNPLISDPGHPANLKITRGANSATLTFGLDFVQQPNYTLRLVRSTSLKDFTTELASNAGTYFVQPPGGAPITIVDSSLPTEGKAFYRLESEPR